MLPFILSVVDPATARSERGEENTERAALLTVPRDSDLLERWRVWQKRRQPVKPIRRKRESQIPIRQRSSTFHPRAQRNAFRRRVQATMRQLTRQSLDCTGSSTRAPALRELMSSQAYVLAVATLLLLFGNARPASQDRATIQGRGCQCEVSEESHPSLQRKRYRTLRSSGH